MSNSSKDQDRQSTETGTSSQTSQQQLQLTAEAFSRQWYAKLYVQQFKHWNTVSYHACCLAFSSTKRTGRLGHLQQTSLAVLFKDHGVTDQASFAELLHRLCREQSSDLEAVSPSYNTVHKERSIGLQKREMETQTVEDKTSVADLQEKLVQLGRLNLELRQKLTKALERVKSDKDSLEEGRRQRTALEISEQLLLRQVQNHVPAYELSRHRFDVEAKTRAKIAELEDVEHREMRQRVHQVRQERKQLQTQLTLPEVEHSLQSQLAQHNTSLDCTREQTPLQ